ncbi:TetR/AcrR family transcriptional regulator [Methylocapsa acidiphila]|uniref:TetR/AcrR family transcriptional regulator n=1 Tax=Methylocapsa acidiphila TaxID=133552 RepID=UPI0018DDE14F|nr:TetR/AcrR family transcriptional regulator [Methylocapsa acidiphila]
MQTQTSGKKFIAMQSQQNYIDDILNTAELLFRAKGYHATTSKDIAELCHIPEEEILLQFGGTQEIALAVMQKLQLYFDRNIFIYAYENKQSPDMRLLNFNSAVMKFFSTDNPCCVFGMLAVEALDTTPRFIAPIQYYFDTWTNAYEVIFANVYDTDEAALLANDFVSDLQGALIMMRVVGTNEPLLRLSARSLKALRSRLATHSDP